MMDFEKLVEMVQEQAENEIERGVYDLLVQNASNIEDAKAFFQDLCAEYEMPYYSQVKEFYNEFFFEINDTIQEFNYNIEITKEDDLVTIAYKVFDLWVLMAEERFMEAVEEMEE